MKANLLIDIRKLKTRLLNDVDEIYGIEHFFKLKDFNNKAEACLRLYEKYEYEFEEIAQYCRQKGLRLYEHEISLYFVRKHYV